jgi:hypothetical protein
VYARGTELQPGLWNDVHAVVDYGGANGFVDGNEFMPQGYPFTAGATARGRSTMTDASAVAATRLARTALYQAAHVLLHHGRWSSLRSWAMRIAKRRHQSLPRSNPSRSTGSAIGGTRRPEGARVRRARIVGCGGSAKAGWSRGRPRPSTLLNPSCPPTLRRRARKEA